MTWLTWRAHRLTLLLGTAFLVGLGAMFGGLAAALRILYPDGNIDVCALVPAHDAPPHCSGDSLEQLLAATSAGVLAFVELLGPFIPLVVGAFFGAAVIAQEFHSGTARWALTQGISRDQWLRGVVSTVFIFAAGGFVVFQAGYLLWRAVLGSHAPSSLLAMTFSLGPILMGTKILLAIVIGMGVGAVVRNPWPAVVLSWIGWIAAMIFIDPLGSEIPTHVIEVGVGIALSVLGLLGLRMIVARRTG